jgi:formamidopyrimidine-DNA glycosylase
MCYSQLTNFQFVLHLSDESGPTTQLAFLDARRLSRIRLCASPLLEPPISALGFDPILSMPSFDAFKPLVLKTARPIKALLLDQSFSAGVGNWLAGNFIPINVCGPSTQQDSIFFYKMRYCITHGYIRSTLAEAFLNSK